tara:strand:+ start:80 stop:397 length:318 start_codon:yes stop_codon:yes gene_type:complete
LDNNYIINKLKHRFTYLSLNNKEEMSYFTWKEDGLTSDCSTLDSMASRFEESARLMRRMAKEGFRLKVKKEKQLIIHSNPEIFEDWGFINEEPPYRQLMLIPEDD